MSGKKLKFLRIGDVKLPLVTSPYCPYCFDELGDSIHLIEQWNPRKTSRCLVVVAIAHDDGEPTKRHKKKP